MEAVQPPTLGEKLDPRRFPGMSNKMAALVAYVLGDEATFETEPAITGLIATGGIVIASDTNDPLYDNVIGATADFDRNWDNLIKAAKLTRSEKRRIRRLLARSVRRTGGA